MNSAVQRPREKPKQRKLRWGRKPKALNHNPLLRSATVHSPVL